MKIILCVDDNMGMLFNKRRQSRDTEVIRDIFKTAEKVWIHSFSEKMFLTEGYEKQIITDDDFLKKATDEDFCFVENQELMMYSDSIEEIILYCWNRKYPSDFKMDLDLSKWKLQELVEFVGKSHGKITKKILVPIDI